MPRRTSTLWTFAITATALFMVSLDNLVVTMALPVIRRDLGASLSDLEWTVNAYTLTFAALLLMGAALGDRFGRRRMFTIGIAIFTLGSAAAALAPTSGMLIAARAAQGLGGAISMPLTLTILSGAISPERRPLALGAWGGISGLAVALGPVIGGAITQGLSWHWIFWLNVPIGIATVVMARMRLGESHGPDRSLDLGGVALASLGLVGIVWGMTHGNGRGWTDWQIVASIGAGLALIVAFVIWEARAQHPMLPLNLFRRRTSLVANGISFLMSFGMFGSIFLLSQFFQIVQGLNPLESGIRILPWTATPVIVAPIAGWASGRIGARPILVSGLALMALGLGWIAALGAPGVSYASLVPAFIVSGAGMGLFFAPIANVVLSAVPREDEGKASGANNTIRELGGVFGIAMLGAIFSAAGSYATPRTYTDGLVPAVWVGAGVVAVGAVLALVLPAAVARLARTEPRSDFIAAGGAELSA
ncbi:MAG: DHA2 family efflux MFS transporter permease subunit [Candidatus Limnocylindrales bacterium]|jgi:EmrB/QacA subfamily drug resistance transporter